MLACLFVPFLADQLCRRVFWFYSVLASCAGVLSSSILCWSVMPACWLHSVLVRYAGLLFHFLCLSVQHFKLMVVCGVALLNLHQRFRLMVVSPGVSMVLCASCNVAVPLSFNHDIKQSYKPLNPTHGKDIKTIVYVGSS